MKWQLFLRDRCQQQPVFGARVTSSGRAAGQGLGVGRGALWQGGGGAICPAGPRGPAKPQGLREAPGSGRAVRAALRRAAGATCRPSRPA